MKVLLFPRRPPWDPWARAFRRQHEVLTVGAPGRGDFDVFYDPARDSISHILGRLPTGWTPDFCLLCSVEYFDFPLDIEHAPIPTIALLSDYTLRFDVMRRAARFLDLVITCDEELVAPLRAYGANEVATFPWFGLDEDVFFPQALEKIYDVSFVGNFHPQVQRYRTKFVEERLLPLARRYRVFVGNVWGDDYARLLNQSKIVFNLSIRGELNMRLFETMGCGSLAILEASNKQAPRFFEDRRHLVYFDEGSFEDTIAHYLAHEEERQQIAAAGHREALAHHTYAHRAEQIIDLVERLGPLGARSATSLPAAERETDRAAVHLCLGQLQSAVARSGEVLASTGVPVRVITDAAVISAWSRRSAGQDATAIFESVGPVLHRTFFERDPSYSLAYFQFCAFAHERATSFTRGDANAWTRMSDLWDAFIGFLVDQDLSAEQGMVAPPVFDRLELEWQLALFAADPQRMKDLLLWKSYASRGHAAMQLENWVLAAESFEAALSLVPDDGHAHRRLGQIRERLGEPEIASTHYRQAVASEPFFFAAQLDLARLLARQEDWTATAFVAERALESAAIPGFEAFHQQFEELLARAARP